mgnify:CR=1 FL=1
MMEKRPKLLCPSILNLAIDNIREEVVKLDKKYITEWRMGLDVKILFQTVRVVLGRDGAM